MENNTTLSGTWQCTHWYPNKDDEEEDVSVHKMQGHQLGNELVLQSTPDQDRSYMLVRLSLNDDIATGTWHETTLASGDFKGALYSGAGQLVLSSDRQRMEGQWAGAGFDHKLGKTRIYTGKWELVRVD